MRGTTLAAAAFCLTMLLWVGAVGFAQENSTDGPALKEIPNTPQASSQSRKTAVTVIHEGSDPVGLRLAYHLKEELNRSSLFRLSTKDERKVQLILTTMEEFGGRPELSSAFSAVWLYSENEATLKYFLQSEVGLASGVTVQQTAEALAAKTDDVAAQYAYLLE